MLRRLVRLLVLGRTQGWRTWLLKHLRHLRPTAPRAEPAAPPVRVAPPRPAGDLPPGFEPLVRLDEVPPGGVIEVRLGGRPVVIARTDEGVFCISAVCAHAGGPLGDGTLEGTALTCPYHGWSYDVRDGSCLVDPSVSIHTFPCVVADGVVCVRPPA